VDQLFNNLMDERTQKEALIRNYAETAAVESRDLSESEQQTMTSARSRIGAIDSQLVILADDLVMADSIKDKLRTVSHASASMTKVSYRSAGELLWDVLHQGDENVRSRYSRAMKRAAEHMGTDKTKTVPVAGDLGGLIPSGPIVGPIIDPYPGGMPFATALGLTASPDALHWLRPRIVDPDFATSVGPQGSGATLGFEKAELPSKAFNVTSELVPMVQGGTYLNISQQLLSWVPGALDTIVGHMNKRLSNWIEGQMLSEMFASAGKVTLAADADASAILKAIYDATAMVYAATGQLATWIAMGPLGYARLGSLVDLAGRPLFPTLGPANAIGTSSASDWTGSVAGLRTIVTPGITDATFWVGNGSVLEGALYRYPVLEAVEPSVMGRQIAIAASVAGYRPFPDGAVHLAP
jgi:hypothetical protein